MVDLGRPSPRTAALTLGTLEFLHFGTSRWVIAVSVGVMVGGLLGGFYNLEARVYARAGVPKLS